MWSIILEPRNGRGLPVEGNTVTPYEAGTEHHVVEFERELSLGRPYFLGSHPCTRGEFASGSYVFGSYQSLSPVQGGCLNRIE